VIGIFEDCKEGIIFAEPIKQKRFIDSTGAGDAFGAGLLSKLYLKEAFSFSDFFIAIVEARIWAAYACNSFGGVGNCLGEKYFKYFL
jgi:sugar/nucleoside kinase (ribokinase family)